MYNGNIIFTFNQMINDLNYEKRKTILFLMKKIYFFLLYILFLIFLYSLLFILYHLRYNEQLSDFPIFFFKIGYIAKLDSFLIRIILHIYIFI